jgi:hypothetical protein
VLNEGRTGQLEEAGHYPIHVSDNKLVAPYLRQKVGGEWLEYLIKSIERERFTRKETPARAQPIENLHSTTIHGTAMGRIFPSFNWMWAQPLLEASIDPRRCFP